DTAFKVMCHQYIRPPILMTIIVIVIRTTSDEKISKPINKKVTTNIASNEIPILCNVSGHILHLSMLVMFAATTRAVLIDSK
ncbi:hypothetical protein ALC60_14835, partial [Trachymyrmex zeteki]